MNSRNGTSKEFRIAMIHPVKKAKVTIDFSFRYQAMKYWTREKWISHTDIGGREKQKFLYLHHYFQIDWGQLIVGDDADKLSRVRNAEFQGARIFITPHTDIPSREFEVISLKQSGEQDLEFSQWFNRDDSPGNKGMIVTYKTVNPYYNWEIMDPDIQQGILIHTIQLIRG